MLVQKNSVLFFLSFIASLKARGHYISYRQEARRNIAIQVKTCGHNNISTCIIALFILSNLSRSCVELEEQEHAQCSSGVASKFYLGTKLVVHCMAMRNIPHVVQPRR